MSLRTNAYALLALMVLLAIAGDWADATAPWWCLPAGLLLLGLAYERLYASRAELALDLRLPTARPRLGRLLSADLSFTQRSRRPLGVEFAPEPPAGIHCERTVLAFEASTTLALGLVPKRLGRASWGPQRARVAGPLGLAWWPQTLRPATEATVVPDLLGGDAPRDGLGPQGGRQAPRRGNGSELLQLRPYQPGDALRSIDWKSTARAGALIARDHLEEQSLDVLVAIDAGRASSVWCGELDRLGHYVNVAARLAELAVSQGDRIGLVVYGDRLLASVAPGRGVGAVLRVRSQLAAVRCETTDSNPILAANHIRTLVRRRCLVVLLTEVDDVAGDGQLVSAMALLRGTHLPLVVGLRSVAASGFAAGDPSDWLTPYRALAASENRRIESRSVAALQALGVHALLARPERLEPELFARYAAIRRQRRV